MVARTGGFLARKGDGEPGAKTIWEGSRDVRASAHTLKRYAKWECCRVRITRWLSDMKRRAARLGQSLARGATIEPPACQRFHARLDFKD